MRALSQQARRGKARRAAHAAYLCCVFDAQPARDRRVEADLLEVQRRRGQSKLHAKAHRISAMFHVSASLRFASLRLAFSLTVSPRAPRPAWWWRAAARSAPSAASSRPEPRPRARNNRQPVRNAWSDAWNKTMMRPTHAPAWPGIRGASARVCDPTAAAPRAWFPQQHKSDTIPVSE